MDKRGQVNPFMAGVIDPRVGPSLQLTLSMGIDSHSKGLGKGGHLEL
jgi:hypothetical protein